MQHRDSTRTRRLPTLTLVASLRSLGSRESDGQIHDKLAFLAKPTLLVIDELGYSSHEQRGAHLFFVTNQLVTR